MRNEQSGGSEMNNWLLNDDEIRKAWADWEDRVPYGDFLNEYRSIARAQLRKVVEQLGRAKSISLALEHEGEMPFRHAFPIIWETLCQEAGKVKVG